MRSPTTTGKIERFHQSLRKEFLADRSFTSLEHAQAELDRWVTDYNTVGGPSGDPDEPRKGEHDRSAVQTGGWVSSVDPLRVIAQTSLGCCDR